jgi:hypothetical protein
MTIRQVEPQQDELGSSITSSAMPIPDLEVGEYGRNSECEGEGEGTPHGGHTKSRQKPRDNHSTGIHTSVECDLAEQESAPQHLSSPNRESIQDSDFSVHWNNVVSRVPVDGSSVQTGTCCIAECIDDNLEMILFWLCVCGGTAIIMFLSIWFGTHVDDPYA